MTIISIASDSKPTINVSLQTQQSTVHTANAQSVAHKCDADNEIKKTTLNKS